MILQSRPWRTLWRGPKQLKDKNISTLVKVLKEMLMKLVIRKAKVPPTSMKREAEKRPPTGNRKTSPNKLPPLLRTSGTRSPASTKNRPPDACSGSNRTSRRSSAIAYPGIFISAEEHNVTNIHALILGPPGTPYEGGFFHFLIKCPADYPHSPPRVRLMTTDAGRVRFGPSFYENGKVCLGLLGTSSYGTTWSSSQCLGNVLYTIKSLMTNEDPVTLGSGLRSPPGARNVAERQDTLQHHPAARDHQGRCVQRGRGMSAKKVGLPAIP
ncbi:hypothetical protein HPB51_015825 [Rhipicephalus microplus]|uniref:Ubiquitin-conjugating enzyme E2 Z n=1 Tax=Rhipicephalus microplus TaxID=6941 RepID=A0A9J6F4Q7_RHIMP|nr:hypothetical protein HPB51_015825 [Rhipicephalus microplus]